MNITKAFKIKNILNDLEIIEKELKNLSDIQTCKIYSMRAIKENKQKSSDLIGKLIPLWRTENRALIEEMVQRGIDYLKEEKSYLLEKLEEF